MSDFESDPRVKRLEAIKHARASAKSKLHQQELEASVAEFEESLSKDSRVSVKKDDGEA